VFIQNHTDIFCTVDEEQQAHIKDINEAQTIKTTLEQRLESTAKVLKVEQEKAEQLGKRLAKCEESICKICQEREAYKKEAEKVNIKFPSFISIQQR
jgi:septal ring factor EnvC (AmiA/AmiB activator)